MNRPILKKFIARLLSQAHEGAGGTGCHRSKPKPVTEDCHGSYLAADWIIQLEFHRDFTMILIALIYLLGGSFIDDLAFMILATPIFYPVIIKLGFDPIWFGMMIGITVMIGVVIPPVAINVFVVKNITQVPFGVIYKGVYPFLISLVVCAALLFLFPQIARTNPPKAGDCLKSP